MLPERRGRSRKELPAINSKLLAFIAGVALTLLGAGLVRPLLESEPPPSIPSIEVGAASPPAKQQRKRKKTKERRKQERRGRESRGAPQTSESASPPSSRFTPARPAPKPEPLPEPAPAPPPVSDDDDGDDDDGGDDDGTSDD
jgi:hypothetical protein